jgi:hypothetical protein
MYDFFKIIKLLYITCSLAHPYSLFLAHVTPIFSSCRPIRSVWTIILYNRLYIAIKIIP